MPIQSISTQENEYGVVIHVSVIWYKSLPFDQEKKKKKKKSIFKIPGKSLLK